MTSTSAPAGAVGGVPPEATNGDSEHLLGLVRRSHEVITGHQHESGAYPASPTFSAYAGYAWYRDGAFTAEGVSRYGDVTSASRFHDWAADVLTSRADLVRSLVAAAARGDRPADDQMLPTRYTLSGQDSTDAWWDFQTDGYGTWLWSVVAHAGRHRLDLGRWGAAVELAVDYLVAFWDRPCYDWWEEHVEQRHTSTLGAIHAGLASAAASGLLDHERAERATRAADDIRRLVLVEGVAGGGLTKWLGSTDVDASLAACVVPYGLVPVGDPVATATMKAVQNELDLGGGVHRYGADVFYGGGQWPLLTALLGWNLAVAGDVDGAWRSLRWVARQATPTGELPEQVDHHLLAPDHQRGWLERWGPVATPLLWSHGMYLILADELGLLADAGITAAVNGIRP